MSEQPPQQVLVVIPTKSVGIAIALTFVLGPLGMLYSTILGAIVMFVLNVLALLLTAGLGLLLTWPTGIIWAALAANSHNKRLLAGATRPRLPQSPLPAVADAPSGASLASDAPIEIARPQSNLPGANKTAVVAGALLGVVVIIVGAVVYKRMVSDRSIAAESSSSPTVSLAQIAPDVGTTEQIVGRADPFVLPAVINDPDGYTNVRARNSASSDIVATVQDGETFYTFDQTGRWWQVKTKAGKFGYMHVSRIKLSTSGAAQPISNPSPWTETTSGNYRTGTFLDRFWDINTRILRPNDLQGLSTSELGLLRNFVFARHGRPFVKPVYRSYFSQFGWYRPDPAYSDSLLTEIERTNVEIVRRQEAVGGGTN